MKGDIIGEYAFFTQIQKATNITKSVGVTELHVLKFSDFQDIIQRFPEEREQYQYIKDQMSLNRQLSVLGLECIICRESDHNESECPYIFYGCKKVQTRLRLGAVPANQRETKNQVIRRKRMRFHSLLSQLPTEIEINRYLNNRVNQQSKDTTNSSKDQKQNSLLPKQTSLKQNNSQIIDLQIDQTSFNHETSQTYHIDSNKSNQTILDVQKEFAYNLIIPISEEDLGSKNIDPGQIKQNPSNLNIVTSKNVQSQPGQAHPENNYLKKKEITEITEDIDQKQLSICQLSPEFDQFDNKYFVSPNKNIKLNPQPQLKSITNGDSLNQCKSQNKDIWINNYSNREIKLSPMNSGLKVQQHSLEVKPQIRKFKNSSNTVDGQSFLNHYPKYKNNTPDEIIQDQYSTHQKQHDQIQVPLEDTVTLEKDCQIMEYRIYFPHNNFSYIIEPALDYSERRRNTIINILSKSKSIRYDQKLLAK